MKRMVLAALLVVACGDDTGYEPAPPDNTPVAPGESLSLASLVSEAAGAASVAWSVDSGGGTVTQAGVYTAPSCATILAALAAPDVTQVGLITATDYVRATWDGGQVVISVSVAERVLGVTVTPSSVSVDPGGQIQFTATVDYTCHQQHT